jgi:hypothetical protein
MLMLGRSDLPNNYTKKVPIAKNLLMQKELGAGEVTLKLEKRIAWETKLLRFVSALLEVEATQTDVSSGAALEVESSGHTSVLRWHAFQTGKRKERRTVDVHNGDNNFFLGFSASAAHVLAAKVRVNVTLTLQFEKLSPNAAIGKNLLTIGSTFDPEANTKAISGLGSFATEQLKLLTALGVSCAVIALIVVKRGKIRSSIRHYL